ncbi:MAG: hypothetical protein ABFQ89_03815 [Chloroflexota bacterium]
MSAKPTKLDEHNSLAVSWMTATQTTKTSRIIRWSGVIPFALALITWLTALSQPENQIGSHLAIAAFALSLTAVMVQLPSFAVKIDLDEDVLHLMLPIPGVRSKQSIKLSTIESVSSGQLKRPPEWIVLIWLVIEIVMLLGIISALVTRNGQAWYWVSGLIGLLSFWPLMTARWQASQNVWISYSVNDVRHWIRIWTTPAQAQWLIMILTPNIPRIDSS